MTSRGLRISTIAAGAVLVLACLLVIQAGDSPGENQSAADADIAHVTGRLLDSHGEPGSRIPVVVRSIDPPKRSQQTFTDSDGRFAFEGLGHGTQRIFEIRIYVDGGKGQCEVLESRDFRFDGNPCTLAI